MRWIVEYADEAAGMVRYGEYRTTAASKEEALKKFGEWSKDCGPGFFSIGAYEDKTQ